MRVRKILFAAISLIVLIFGTVVFAQNDEIPSHITNELNVYGILQGDENGDYHLDDIATRAEFSAMLIRTLKINDVVLSTEQRFSDVDTSDWFYNDVCNLVSCGIINGYPDGTFRPNASLTPAEAAKMLVAAFGYTTYAEMAGGYPEGYMAQAARLGLLNDVKFADEVTRGNLVRMLYNSLDVQLMELTYSKNGTSLSAGDMCVRDLHQYEDDDSGLIEHEGIIEANTEAWLYAPYDLEMNQVVIDGQIYDVGETDAYNYLGMEVEFFASYNESDYVYTLESVVPTDNNEKIVFNEREYMSGSSSEIKGEKDGKTHQYRLDDDFILIKNMNMVQSPKSSDFDILRGTVTVINNDDNNRYDVVIIEEFESVLVESANENGIWLEEGTIDGMRMFPLYEDVTYFITDAEGKIITAEEIEPFSVISLTADKDKTLYRIRVSEDKVSGMIEKKDTDYIVIDGEELPLESGTYLDISFKEETTCYLNFRGEVAFTDTSDFIYDYAYVAGVARDDDGETILVRLVLPGSFVADEKIDLDDEDAKATAILKAHNQEVKSFELREKVKVNGGSVKAEVAERWLKSLTQPVVRFAANSEGLITDLSEPEIIGTNVFETNLYREYNGTEMLFGGLNIGAFGVHENTKALCIPDSTGISTNKDYLAGVEMVDEGTYTVNGYDLIEDSGNAQLVVLQTALRYNSDYGFDENKVAVLENIRVEIDDDDEEKASLTFWSQNERHTMLAEPEVVSELRKGDIFLYSLGVTNDEIMAVEQLASLSDIEYGTVTIPGGVSSRYATFAMPVDVEYNCVLDSELRRADIITVKTREDSENETEFNIFKRNSPPIYIYNTDGKTIQPGTTADLILGGSDDVFFYSSASKLRVCVIVR